MLKRKTAATVCIIYTMEPDLPPCLQQCCQEVWQAEEKESRRLVLPREDAKAVDKYSRRERQMADGGWRQDENGDKKARAAQRATQGRHLHGYQGCRQVQQERTADGRRRTANGRRERRQNENGNKTRTATRRLMLRRELLKDAKRAGHH